MFGKNTKGNVMNSYSEHELKFRYLLELCNGKNVVEKVIVTLPDIDAFLAKAKKIKDQDTKVKNFIFHLECLLDESEENSQPYKFTLLFNSIDSIEELCNKLLLQHSTKNLLNPSKEKTSSLLFNLMFLFEKGNKDSKLNFTELEN